MPSVGKKGSERKASAAPPASKASATSAPPVSKASATSGQIRESLPAFVALLNESNLRRLAGPRFYERGVNYAISGRVTRLVVRKRSVEASVEGTARYRVELWLEGDELAANCNCPVGDRGDFCKHCVATGLLAKNATSRKR